MPAMVACEVTVCYAAAQFGLEAVEHGYHDDEHRHAEREPGVPRACRPPTRCDTSRRLAYEWTIGTRYLRSAHRSGFVSFVAFMSVAGLALGVAVLIVVMSVLNGFETELRNRMLTVTSHATITGIDGVIPNWRKARADAAVMPSVAAVVPFIEARGLLANGQRVAGSAVRGILPEEKCARSVWARA